MEQSSENHSLFNIVILGFYLLLIAPNIASFFGTWALELKACPRGTLIYGALDIEGGLESYCVVATFILGMLILIRVNKNKLAPDQYRKFLPAFNIGAPVLAAIIAITTVCGLWNSLSQYCATPQFIFYRTSPRAPFQRLEWSDVTSIRTNCQYHSGKYGGWQKAYVVHFKNGMEINFKGGPGLHQHIDTLQHILHGRPIVFDMRYVDTNCPNLNIYGTAP